MMTYATCDDIDVRRNLQDDERDRCQALLEDAAVIIDAYNKKAPDEAKKLVSCNMVLRAMADTGIPIGATQGSVSALGYSQSWSNSNGSSELYLTKIDKKILGAGNKIGFLNCFKAEGS